VILGTAISTQPRTFDDVDGAWLPGLFGVGGQAAGRAVQLSARSSVECPAHGLTLYPDSGCRTCAWLGQHVRA
jgi:hypothetical protein